ncbi:MAG: carbohydrate ABC transporter permease [Paenibacillaceae bacterium]|nr:carbohydrate ABC transporter permease [Paenibacillaceae bacterium]
MVSEGIRKQAGEQWYQIFAVAVIVVVTVLSLYPLLHVLSMSLVSEQEWTAKGGFVLWPSAPTWLAYKRLFAAEVFVDAMWISILRTILGTGLSLTAMTVTAYVVSRKGLPGRKLFLFCVLLTILFSGGLIPTYLLVRDLHMLDSVWALVIPGLVDSWSVLVLKQFFENLPTEIEDSAKIDGAGEATLMFRIIVPMCAPAMAAIGLFAAVGHWNAWFDAMIYINKSSLFPLQLLIRNLLVNPELGSQFNPTQVIDASSRVSVESLKMATVVFGIVPILCVYPFLQKYFVKGMYLGAVKG